MLVMLKAPLASIGDMLAQYLLNAYLHIITAALLLNLYRLIGKVINVDVCLELCQKGKIKLFGKIFKGCKLNLCC